MTVGGARRRRLAPSPRAASFDTVGQQQQQQQYGGHTHTHTLPAMEQMTIETHFGYFIIFHYYVHFNLDEDTLQW